MKLTGNKVFITGGGSGIGHWRPPRIHRIHVLDYNNERKLMSSTEDAQNETLIDHFDVEVGR